MEIDVDDAEENVLRSYELERRRMVEEQLQPRGIVDPRVLDAMLRVPREQFVPAAFRAVAYADQPLPIGYGQTISQPFTVAFMCQALGLEGHEKVLEIGAGSGYGAAVLAELARQVYAVERIAKLAERARERLKRLGYRNVEVRVANGTLGLAQEAPFHAIVVAAGAPDLPRAYAEQLAEAGRLVIPLGARQYEQRLYRCTKRGGRLTCDDLGAFAFVPLVANLA
jgi:protein-L-isoaspartate(D-aspartate) O-methyltransferase